jgi:hypothetical protein
VLAPVLVRCDGANVRFLRGFGFEVTTTTRTADDELPLWVLVRQPQSR